MDAKRRQGALVEFRRRRLLPFVEAMVPSYKAGWFHKDLCVRLERFSQAVADGKSPRLMLFCPPRHGKTVVSSQCFPVWHMGRNPNHEVMAVSYGAELAEANSREARTMFASAAYRAAFPHMRMDRRSQAAAFWRSLPGASYLAAGVGGAITGRGAHLLVVDDPVKNREEADSATTRERTYNWYLSTAYTRLAPGGGVLLIQTRWHDEDLAGRLLVDMEKGADQWEVVKYPAVASEDEKYRKRGEALHDERWPLSELERIQSAQSPREWAALYQQSPVSEAGAYFRQADFRRFRMSEADTASMRFYTVWDLALGETDQSDWTVGLTAGLDHQDNLYVVDLVRGRWRAHEIVERIIQQHQLWKARLTGIEHSHIEMAIGPYLAKRKREEGLHGLVLEPLKHQRRDKPARARSIQGRLQQGRVLVPEDREWTQMLISEMLRFPAGKHDDMVDSMAWMGLMLDRQVPPPNPAKMARHKVRRVERLVREASVKSVTSGRRVRGRRSSPSRRNSGMRG